MRTKLMKWDKSYFPAISLEDRTRRDDWRSQGAIGDNRFCYGQTFAP
jgi:hypothetical protein